MLRRLPRREKLRSLILLLLCSLVASPAQSLPSPSSQKLSLTPRQAVLLALKQNPQQLMQTAVFYLVDTIGLSLGVNFAVWIGVPRFGGAKTADLGILLFRIANTIFVLIWTDMTPGNYIGHVLLLLGIGTGLLLPGVSLLSTRTLDRRFQNEAASYFFLRQVGASLGVTAAAVLIDQRMTMHSSRLLDTANRLDPVAQRVLQDFAFPIATLANGTSVPDPGN